VGNRFRVSTITSLNRTINNSFDPTFRSAITLLLFTNSTLFLAPSCVFFLTAPAV
jgi:hypothetical protein